VAYGGRLLVVEDNPLAFRSLERVVSRYRPIRHANSFESALVELRSRKDWCGFLFDVRLPDRHEGGLELLEIAAKEFPYVPGAVVTGLVEPWMVNRVAAASGTLLDKAFDENDLLPFLQRVIAREHGFANDFSERLAAASRSFALSPREHEVLAWFVAGGTRDGYLAFTGMAETTLKTHVKHLLQKTKCASLPESVALTLRHIVVRHSKSRPPPHHPTVTLPLTGVAPAARSRRKKPAGE
jgi:DNA-binding NarL/FixJ family response regulator